MLPGSLATLSCRTRPGRRRLRDGDHRRRHRWAPPRAAPDRLCTRARAAAVRAREHDLVAAADPGRHASCARADVRAAVRYRRPLTGRGLGARRGAGLARPCPPQPGAGARLPLALRFSGAAGRRADLLGNARSLRERLRTTRRPGRVRASPARGACAVAGGRPSYGLWSSRSAAPSAANLPPRPPPRPKTARAQPRAATGVADASPG